MTEMDTSMAMEMTKYYEDEQRDDQSDAVGAAEPKKRSAPLRMSRDDAYGVLRELRKYPKKSTDSFATKKEVMEIILPGLDELHNKKGYTDREIAAILRKMRVYNYTPKEITTALSGTPPEEGRPPASDGPNDSEVEPSEYA